MASRTCLLLLVIACLLNQGFTQGEHGEANPSSSETHHFQDEVEVHNQESLKQESHFIQTEVSLHKEHITTKIRTYGSETSCESDAKFVKRKAFFVKHIKQHLEDQIAVDTSNMTQEQLEFHYFNMYDTDKNGMLDGIELIKAITHLHGTEKEDTANPPKRVADVELEKMVDDILKDDDFNNDGFVDYTEFVKSQKRS